MPLDPKAAEQTAPDHEAAMREAQVWATVKGQSDRGNIARAYLALRAELDAANAALREAARVTAAAALREAARICERTKGLGRDNWPSFYEAHEIAAVFRSLADEIAAEDK